MNDFLQRTEPRSIGMILSGLLLLIITAQLMYLLWPQIKAYNKVSSSHQLLQTAVSSNEGLELQLANARTDVESLGNQLHGDMAGLPAKQMEAYIIGRLQKVSWETDVELISVKPGDGKRVQMFQESLFDVELKAGYLDFFQWLNSIARDLGFIVIKKYAIQPTGSSLQDPDLNITLTMVSFRVEQG